MQLLEQGLSLHEQRLIKDENCRLREILTQKDELLQELTCKLVEYQHADMRRQQAVAKRLGEAREQTRKARKEHPKKNKQRIINESLSWFRAALSEQVAQIKTHYESSLEVLERKHQEDLNELETKYQLLLKVKSEQLDSAQVQLKNTRANHAKCQGLLESSSAKWHEKELKYDQLMNRSEKGISRLQNEVLFIQKERDRLQAQLHQAIGLLEESRQALRAKQDQHGEELARSKDELYRAHKQYEQKLAKAQQAYLALEERCILRDRNIEKLSRTNSQEFPKKASPQKCQTAEISAHYQRVIDQLALSNSLKDKQLQTLKRKIAQYRNHIRLDQSSNDRIDEVQQAGSTVKSLYEGFKTSLKNRLPRS